MSRIIYTDEMKDYMREIVPGRRIAEVTKLMNEKFDMHFKESQMTNLKSALKLRNGLSNGVKGQGKITTKEQDAFIHANYKGLPTQKLTDLVNEKFGTNFTVEQMKGYKARNKLNSGLNGRFTKGHQSFNKGLKQTDFMSEEAIERTKATRFQKGQAPVNHRPVGSERITKDGYIEIKVDEPSTWELKHRVVWEEANGKIPNSHAILFLDQDRTNCSLDNLMLVKRTELVRINKGNNLVDVPEINESIVLTERIRQKIREVSK